VAFQVYLKGFSILYDPACRVVHRVASANRCQRRQVFYATRNSLWLIRALQFAEPGAYLRGVREGFSAPVKRRPLPVRLRSTFAPFWRQNSLLHQLLRRA